MFLPSQIEELSSTNFINRIDNSLTIVSEVRFPDPPITPHGDSVVLLYLKVFYDSEQITTMSFNLMNHNYEEVLSIAKDVRSNHALLKEVDDYLAGDIE